MNPKVSILVPVFKASAYIEKCAESIFNQTFEDIQYIFVNDATPDDSMEKLNLVIHRFPARKNQIMIIHNSENKGSGFTKNLALDSASGDYIAFVDSDDYIDADMIEILYLKAINENADIVVSDIFMEYINRKEIINEYVAETKGEQFADMIRNDRLHSFLCDKLVTRNLYLHPECRIPEGLNYLEDRHVMTRLFYFAEKIVKVNRAFYHYIQYNENAITKKKDRMHFENVKLFWNLMDQFMKQKNEFEKFKSVLAVSKVKNKVRLMIDTHSKVLRKEFANLFHNEETNCLSHFKKGEKLMLILIRYRFFELAQLFHNILLIKNRKVLIK